MKTELEILEEITIKKWISNCQLYKHTQQVAFSTYHHALTQICFGCKKIRTSMSEEDITIQNPSEDEV